MYGFDDLEEKNLESPGAVDEENALALLIICVHAIIDLYSINLSQLKLMLSGFCDKAHEVPIVRVYGSTPAGQKTCLHVHRLQPNQEGWVKLQTSLLLIWADDAYTHAVSVALEKALKGGAVLVKSLQPHESHIPFILQFMEVFFLQIDYNLYGMGHLHLLKELDKLPRNSADFQADSIGSESLSSPFWVSSTIPGDWMWQLSSQFDGLSDQNIKRQIVCELEGDATVNDIVNQQFKMYTSLSPAPTDVKMVQSLLPIWEERTEMCEAAMPPDPGKPLPQDVLKTLSLDPEHLSFLKEKNIIASLSLHGEEIGTTTSQGKDVCPKLSCGGQMQSSEMVGTLNAKAAEDLNSDDELLRATILSPLLPETTIDKVLEKANMDYERESQKGVNRTQTSSQKKIPQVDGSSDDLHLCSAESAENPSKIEMKIESERSLEHQNEKFIGQEQGQDSGVCSFGCSGSTSFNVEGKPLDLIAMTFCRKLPTPDSKDGQFENGSCSPTTPDHSYLLTRKLMKEHEHQLALGSMRLFLMNLLLFLFAFQGRALDNILPYFARDCPEEKEFQSKWQKNSNRKSHQEDSTGVPTQYLNDVSCLYMLTPAFSPPSVDCVNRWLLRDEGVGEVNKSSVEAWSLSPKEELHPETDGMVNTELNSDSKEVTTMLQSESCVAEENACTYYNLQPESAIADSVVVENAIIEDEWRELMPMVSMLVVELSSMYGEVKLNVYTIEAVAEAAVLRRKTPSIPYIALTKWFASGPGRGRISPQDFVFAKEVRLGSYSTRASSSLPPAAIVATKAMRADPRAEPDMRRVP
ncbi:hypothetical protein EZV62_006694 [Acer yangbiense]|uniref:DNA polymerase zeta catalytic subunit N-terminal domain-containing protein n=1 Tax=Acer yangbiense TaxID=1000413 RepID=A0A5C7I9K0_9ROSI|nr:hypothetical protein EZV62_006694 [Acer yangbiense]